MIHTGEFTVTELFEMAIVSSAELDNIVYDIKRILPVTCDRAVITLEELAAFEQERDERQRMSAVLEEAWRSTRATADRHKDELGQRLFGLFPEVAVLVPAFGTVFEVRQANYPDCVKYIEVDNG
ncbi:MAG: hypothetical protein EBR82_51040 [Caulobacteraceae bacterium]|nr:hypothetical protein [Caulobacteraceae bacterium]